MYKRQTQEELQQINPYTFLYMYQKGFSYKLGTVKTYGGKAVWEVILTAKDKKQDLERITLYVTKNTYEPLYILLCLPAPLWLVQVRTQTECGS